MRNIKLGQHIVPLWVIFMLLCYGMVSGIAAYYIWTRVTVPLEVKEPLEILSYPTVLSLFPGEREEFNVTLVNHGSIYYNVALDFSLSNITYQDNYVTFSTEVYEVFPGQQNLSAWMGVESHAPPIETSLIIDFLRIQEDTFPTTEQLEIQGATFNTGNTNVTLTVKNIGTVDLVISQYKIGHVGTPTYLAVLVAVAQGTTGTVTIPLTWFSGYTYDIYLFTATGKQFPYRATAP